MKLIKLVSIPVLGKLVYINPLFVESVENNYPNEIVTIRMHSGETHEVQEKDIYKVMYNLEASWEK